VLSPRERGFDSAWPSSEPATGKPEQGETPVAGGQGDPRADRPPAVSILKSGVIDGMAYTLYSDGSIEAELPQGTMRFATIEELRVYLAGTS
jgi:hypothetical protein